MLVDCDRGPTADVQQIEQSSPLMLWASPITTPPATALEARRRVLKLYREWLIEIPRSVGMYHLNLSIPHCRARVRSWFEDNRHITDPLVIHNLTVKSTMELVEMHNRWKQRAQVARLFGRVHEYEGEGERLLRENPKMTPFLADFLSE